MNFISLNGQQIEIPTKYETEIQIQNEIELMLLNTERFDEFFNNYLEAKFGISSEKFKEIIKGLAPEEFV